MAVADDRARSGRLLPPSAAPALGEEERELVRAPAVSVNQILSGRLEHPTEYLQEDDEWALLLEGAALLEIGGQPLHMGPGDWVWLPAGAPHRLVSAEPGTSWVTVHAARPN